jgi:hypothetical protein
MNFCYCGLHALMASCERGATTQSIKAFARTARKRMRIEGSGYRRDYLRALAQRVEVDAQELRIIGSKSELLRTLVAALSAKTAGFGVPSSVPKWRARKDSHCCSRREKGLLWMYCREQSSARRSG